VRSLRSPRENKEQEGQGGSGFPGPAPCHPLTPTVAPLAHFAQPYGVPYDEAYEPTAKTFCLTAAAQPSTSLVWLLCWMQLARPMEVVQVVRFLINRGDSDKMLYRLTLTTTGRKNSNTSWYIFSSPRIFPHLSKTQRFFVPNLETLQRILNGGMCVSLPRNPSRRTRSQRFGLYKSNKRNFTMLGDFMSR